MYLRLSIYRPKKGVTRERWFIEDEAVEAMTMTELLGRINQAFPLNDEGSGKEDLSDLSDYAVEIGTFVFLSDFCLKNVLHQEDEILIRPRSIVCDSGLKEEFVPCVNARNRNEISHNAEINTTHSDSRRTISQDTAVRLDGGKEIGFSPNEARAPESKVLERNDSHSPAKSKLLSSPHPCIQCDVCHGCEQMRPAKWLDVTLSAERGCSKCALIREIILIHAGDVQDTGYSSIIWCVGIWAPSLGFSFDRDEEGYHAVEVFVPPGEFNPLNIITLQIPGNNESTGSEPSFLRALNWIQNCLMNHKRCGRSTGSQLPNRVLDVGDSNTEIKLYETQNESASYVTLSHCWGNSDFESKTTTHTIEQNKRNISWLSLPKTFQDAILFVRKLRIRYLWIDSLCIIQDSEQDWQLESAKMAEVYRNSFLTIAATGSASDHGGLFSPVPAEHRAHRVVRYTNDGLPYAVYYRNEIGHIALSLSYQDHKELGQNADRRSFPLVSRAWVYQEVLLSPRVLHFSRSELTWECMEASDCECGVLHFVLSRGESFRTPAKISHSTTLEFQENPLTIQKRWRKIVEEYSYLSISYKSDKLPAISGLAKQIWHHRPMDEYLAGLWRDSLVLDMLWYPTTVSYRAVLDRPIHSNGWHAPTWSWASLDGGVEYHEYHDSRNENLSHEVLIKILEVICVPVGADSTGKLQSARMTLIGRLIPATLWDIVIPTLKYIATNVKFSGTDEIFYSWLYLDRSNEPYIQDYTYIRMYSADYGPAAKEADRHEQLSRRVDNPMVYCLPVAHMQGNDLFLILLQEVEPELKMHKYRRIGLAIAGLEYGRRFNLPDCSDTMFTLI